MTSAKIAIETLCNGGSSMKAMTISRLGGPEVLRISLDIESPAPREGFSLIRTSATSYNNIDAILRTEDFGLRFPIVPGSDLVGEATSGKLAGQRVIVNPAIPCGECGPCSEGKKCPFVRILGVHQSGAYGEFVLVPESQCFPLSDDISLASAAAFPLVFLTAWRMLKTRAQLEAGQVVAIWGATGGLGSAAIAVTRCLGGIPIALTRRRGTEQALLGYGAEEVFDVESGDVVQELRRVTGGVGADVIFEGPGASTWDRSMAMVRQGGIIVTAGVTSGAKAMLDIEDLYYKQVSILGSRMGYADEFAEVLSQLNEGRLVPLVAGTRGLSEAMEVHQLATDGGRCGKIVMIYDL
jgi:NADPH:quinone reductase-like Zn-dependent oxidoreductase